MGKAASELRIRFDEAKRIYSDSPGVQVTYNDLERVYEDMMTLLDLFEKPPKVGF